MIIASCKNDKSEPAKEVIVQNEIVNLEKFLLEVELKYSQADEIKLFANDVFINNKRRMNISVIEKINKKDVFTTKALDFPENIKPDFQVGLSFGNKIVKSVEIKRIHISYGEAEFDISSQDLNNYFTFNKFISYNVETGVLQTKKIEGKYNPLMFLRKKIIDKL